MAEVNQLKQIWETFAFTRLVRTFRLSVGPAKILIALIILCLVDVVIPVPILGLILIYVVFQRPSWFMELVSEIYNPK